MGRALPSGRVAGSLCANPLDCGHNIYRMRRSSLELEQSVDFSDAFIGRHFGHHPRFARRQPGARWRFRRVRVPLDEVRCLYSDPGVKSDNAAGLTGSVGLAATGYQGRPISDMAAAICRAVDESTANTTNPALRKVLAFQAAGVGGIASAEEPQSAVGARP